MLSSIAIHAIKQATRVGIACDHRFVPQRIITIEVVHGLLHSILLGPSFLDLLAIHVLTIHEGVVAHVFSSKLEVEGVRIVRSTLLALELHQCGRGCLVDWEVPRRQVVAFKVKVDLITRSNWSDLGTLPQWGEDTSFDGLGTVFEACVS